MNKPIIGIANCSSYKSNDNIFDDRYYILNNYIDPIVKNGGVPIGILYKDEKLIKESLELCDAFLIPGGSKIISSHLEIIDYAMRNKKPILGICMGMQALSIYSLYGIKGLKNKNHNLVLINNDTHNMSNPKRNKKDKTTHTVEILKKSLLHDILNKETIKVNSFHRYQILNVGKDYTVSARSKDNIIEAIEHKDKTKFIIGLEWHPELLPKMNNIFKSFIDATKKRN